MGMRHLLGRSCRAPYERSVKIVPSSPVVVPVVTVSSVNPWSVGAALGSGNCGCVTTTACCFHTPVGVTSTGASFSGDHGLSSRLSSPGTVKPNPRAPHAGDAGQIRIA